MLTSETSQKLFMNTSSIIKIRKEYNIEGL